jgi:hypothetical protein
MPRVDRNILKAYFNTGDTPTEGQFCNLIESQINFIEDGHLLGLTDFDENKSYPAGTSTVFGQEIFQALIDVVPGPFNPAEWQQISTDDQEADEVPFDGTTSGLTATDVQGAIDEVIASKGQIDGIASLDGLGKIPASQIPSIAITNVFVVNDIAERDALTVEEGDVAVVLDAFENTGDEHEKKTFIYEDTVGWLVLEEPPGSIQDLDAVLTVGNTTDQDIIFDDGVESTTIGTVGGLFDINSTGASKWTGGGSVVFTAVDSMLIYPQLDLSAGSSTGDAKLFTDTAAKKVSVYVDSVANLSFELDGATNLATMTGGTVEYDIDRSGSYTNRSFVDKEYVDNQIGATNELSEVLTNGNTTGGNSIIISNDQNIQAANGGGELNLRSTADKEMYLSTDGAALDEANVSFIHTAGTTSRVLINGKETTPGANSIVALTAEGPTSTSEVKVSDTGTSITSDSVLVTGNFEVNPSSSFIIGNGIGIDFNDGANTGTLNSTITGAQAWTLPDQTGTLALTSDIVAAQDLQSVLDEGSTASIAGDLDFTSLAGTITANALVGASGIQISLIDSSIPSNTIIEMQPDSIVFTVDDTGSGNVQSMEISGGVMSFNNDTGGGDVSLYQFGSQSAEFSANIGGNVVAIAQSSSGFRVNGSNSTSNEEITIQANLGSDLILRHEDGSTGESTNLQMAIGSIKMDYVDGVNTQTIELDGSMTITDAINSKGIEYAADYSAAYTARTLVDKAYVDSLSGASNLRNVLVAGNTTNGNNIIMSNGDAVASGSGGGYLDLRADSGAGATDNRVFLVNDGGSFTKEGVWMEDNYNVLFTAGFNSYLEFDNTLGTPKSTWQNTVGDIDLKASGSFLLEAGTINLKKTGSTFTGELTFANTANRTYTLPNNSGTVALTSDIAGAQDLQSVLDTGASASITSDIDIDTVSSGVTTALALNDGSGNLSCTDGTTSSNMDTAIDMITLTYQNALGQELKFELSDTLGGVVTDEINSKGLIYNDDYSANFTSRSLVDKSYVDSQVGSNDELSEVLTTGNTTGGTNIVTSSDDAIAAASGGGYLDLRANAGAGATDNRVFLVNDGGSFTKEGVWMEDNYNVLFTAGFNSYLEFDNTLGTPKSTWQNTVGDIDLKASGSFLLEAGTINLKKTGSTFTGELTFANTANRTYTLPNATGTIALLSDITAAAQDLQSVLDEGSTATINGAVSFTSTFESIILNAGGLLNLDGTSVDLDSSSGDIDITSAAAINGIASGAFAITSQTSTVDITSDAREVNINATLGNVVINSAGGDTGVGTVSPNTKLDVDGDFAIRYSLVNGTTGNPISLIGSDKSAIRTNFTGGGTQSIVAISGGEDGKEMVITNIGDTISLVHEDAGSVAGNRMNMGSAGANLTVLGGDSATFKYDATSSRWRLIAKTV